MTATVSPRAWSFRSLTASDLVLGAGFVVLLAHTLVSLSHQTWSREFGAYGPIVLVTGVWLLGRQLPGLMEAARPGAAWITGVLLAVSWIFYIIGYAFDFVTFEAAGVYGVGFAILQSRVGLRAMAGQWFPLLYLAFTVPPPSAILADVTAPLKQLVSSAATGGLHLVGVPVARQGVTIFVAQYQLLVEDACSGMNSIVGLIAVSLLYVYLMRGSSWIYSLILTAFVVPIAIVANIIRIMILILLTYFGGNDLAQGYLHFTAGMVLFSSSLLLVFAVDRIIFYTAERRGLLK